MSRKKWSKICVALRKKNVFLRFRVQIAKKGRKKLRIEKITKISLIARRFLSRDTNLDVPAHSWPEFYSQTDLQTDKVLRGAWEILISGKSSRKCFWLAGGRCAARGRRSGRFAALQEQIRLRRLAPCSHWRCPLDTCEQNGEEGLISCQGICS